MKLHDALAKIASVVKPHDTLKFKIFPDTEIFICKNEYQVCQGGTSTNYKAR